MYKFLYIVKLAAFVLTLHSMPLLAKPLSIIYSGNLDGELEPCGCSDEGDLGGIKRRATLLDKLKHDDPHLIVVSSGGLLSSEGSGDKLKSQYILQAYGQLGYDAIGIQWRDLAYGPDFLLGDNIPWVASNWQNDQILKQKLVERKIANKNYRLAVFSWLDPDGSPMRQMQGEHTLVDDKFNKMIDAIRVAKQNGAITMLSTSQPIEAIKTLFPLKNIDLLIVKSAYEVFGEPQKVGDTLVLQPGSRGMRIARLDLEFDNQNHIKKWQHDVLPMPESVADAQRLSNWYQTYNEKVKADYLKRTEMRKKLRSGESDYVGEEQCQACHQAQYKIWSESQHALAFEDLEAVQKSFDPACIVCHTVGFEVPGGFLDIDITSHLMAVQCESCHGPARVHVQSGGKKPVTNIKWTKEKMCAQCHTQPHSPAFSVQKYWPKIAH